MYNKYFLSSLIFCLCLFTGCNTATNAQENQAVAETTTSQGNTADDLEASLEEAVLTLTTEVSDAISRVNNIGTPSGTTEEQRQQYQELNQELTDLDRRIDELDDTIERNYNSSQISQELFSKLNSELESLEELVDSTEDQLEATFGIYD